MIKGYVDGPHGQIHYRMIGEGPPVALFHQTSWSSWQFINALPVFADAGFQAIAFDSPGYGLSDTPSAPPEIEDYADALAAGLKALGLDQVAAVGHHTGAFIACALSDRHPALVSKTVLCGMPLYTPEERQERLARPHFDQTPRADGGHLAERWKMAMASMGDKAELRSIQNSVMQFFTTGEFEWYGHHAAFRYEAESALKRLTQPVLIHSNEGDMTHAQALRCLEVRDDLAFAELPGGSTHIVFEDAARWAAPIVSFLKDGAQS